jgi:hypothetical protein
VGHSRTGNVIRFAVSSRFPGRSPRSNVSACAAKGMGSWVARRSLSVCRLRLRALGFPRTRLLGLRRDSSLRNIDEGIKHRAVGGYGGWYPFLDALLLVCGIDLGHGGLLSNSHDVPVMPQECEMEEGAIS